MRTPTQTDGGRAHSQPHGCVAPDRVHGRCDRSLPSCVRSVHAGARRAWGDVADAGGSDGSSRVPPVFWQPRPRHDRTPSASRRQHWRCPRDAHPTRDHPDPAARASTSGHAGRSASSSRATCTSRCDGMFLHRTARCRRPTMSASPRRRAYVAYCCRALASSMRSRWATGSCTTATWRSRAPRPGPGPAVARRRATRRVRPRRTSIAESRSLPESEIRVAAGPSPGCPSASQRRRASSGATCRASATWSSAVGRCRRVRRRAPPGGPRQYVRTSTAMPVLRRQTSATCR